MEQTCFTTGGIAIVGALLGAMGGAIGLVFRALLKAQAEIIRSQADTIKTQNEDNREMLDRLDRTLSVNERQTATTETLIQKTNANSRRS